MTSADTPRHSHSFADYLEAPLRTDEGRRFMLACEIARDTFLRVPHILGVLDALWRMFLTRRSWFRNLGEDQVEAMAARILKTQLHAWVTKWGTTTAEETRPANEPATGFTWTAQFNGGRGGASIQIGDEVRLVAGDQAKALAAALDPGRLSRPLLGNVVAGLELLQRQVEADPSRLRPGVETLIDELTTAWELEQLLAHAVSQGAALTKEEG